MHRIPVYSRLFPAAASSDFCRCCLIQISAGSVNAETLSARFQSVVSQKIHPSFIRGFRSTDLIPLLKEKNEIILGMNLRRTEVRISILEDRSRPDLFHFTILINFSTRLAQIYLFTVRLIYIHSYKKILKDLQEAFQEG